MTFDPDLARRIAADRAAWRLAGLPTQAGHDAGVLAAAGIPTAMLFVRNPTGVSHSPAEHAEVAGLSGRCLRPGRHPRGLPDERPAAAYLLERAWVDGAVHDDVLVEIEDGRFTPGPAPLELALPRSTFSGGEGPSPGAR